MFNPIFQLFSFKIAGKRARKSKNYSSDWYFERIPFLGYLFEYEVELYDEYIKFQDVLDVVDQSNISMYDTQDKFEFKVSSQQNVNIFSVWMAMFLIHSTQITPQCEDLFVRCKWGQSILDCSEMFKFRKTPHGYCCLFNYIRQFNTLSTVGYVNYPMSISFVIVFVFVWHRSCEQCRKSTQNRFYWRRNRIDIRFEYDNRRLLLFDSWFCWLQFIYSRSW